MEPNPYESPQTDAAVERAEGKPQRVVRRGVGLAVAVIWNAPLVVILLLMCSGQISERTMERAIAGWTLIIPAASVALGYVPFIQRLVFTAHADMKKMRPRLWIVAAIWLAIFALWCISDILTAWITHPPGTF